MLISFYVYLTLNCPRKTKALMYIYVFYNNPERKWGVVRDTSFKESVVNMRFFRF